MNKKLKCKNQRNNQIFIIQYVVIIVLQAINIANLQGFDNIYDAYYYLFANLILNSIQGNFYFFYVYITCSQFPSSSMQQYEETWLYSIQVIISILMFISTHLKILCRHILKNSTTFMEDGIQNQNLIQSPQQQFLQILNIIISDCISALLQATIFYFGVDIKNQRIKINYWWLYFGTVASFIIIYLLSYFISQLINKKIFTQFKNNRKEFIKITAIQIFYFTVLGLLTSCILNIILSSYDALYQNYHDDPLYPDFSGIKSYDFCFTILSFVLSFSGLFALYLASPAAQTIYKINKNHKNIGNLFFKQVQNFMKIHSKLLLSNLIIAGILITSDLSDYISLIFVILSQGDNYSIFTYILSTIISLGIVALYIYLIYIQSTGNHNRLFAVFTAITGLFAIPSILSMEFVQKMLTSMMPCGWRSGFQRFLSSGLIPFVSIISFLQNVPLMFPNQCIYKNLSNYNSFIKQKINDILNIKRQLNTNTESEGSQENLLENEESIAQLTNQLKTYYPKPKNYEVIYKASKYACGAMTSAQPRIVQQVSFDQKLLKQIKKSKCKITKSEDTIYISYAGTQSMLSLVPVQIIKGLLDWLKATLVIFKPIIINQKEITYVSLLHYLDAVRIQKVINQLIANNSISQQQNIIITGNHQGAGTAIITAYLLKDTFENVKVYTFGLMHLVSENMLSIVNKQVTEFVNIQVGTDGKLFMSQIATNQLRYSNKYSFIIKHAAQGNNIMGYFAILNSGSEPDRVMEACKQIADKQEHQCSDE